jgi:hypothetical protein
MRKVLFIVAILVIAGIVVAQFTGVTRRNPRVNPAQTIEAQTQMPKEVADILHRACRDCHTDQTQWYWYSRVAPFSWLTEADVWAGRSHMNLSRWGQFTPEQKDDRLHGMCELLRKGDMPLWYYKPMHYPSAWLSNEDVNTICAWTEAERKRLPAGSPAPTAAPQ